MVVPTTGLKLLELFVNVRNIVKSNIEYLNNIFKYLEVINFSRVIYSEIFYFLNGQVGPTEPPVDVW